MLIIPAIDIMDGKCVRLYQGRRENVKVYADDVIEVAKRWESDGAELIHIVDLNGAFSGRPVNHRLIEKIIDNINISVEVGGGIRDEEAIELYLDMGAERVVLGTRAINDPDFLVKSSMTYHERIIVSIDAKDGKVAVDGWEKVTDKDAIKFAGIFEEIGIGGVIYTDLTRDGSLTGPNIEAIRELINSVTLPVIASGGVSSMNDLDELFTLSKEGLTGVIVGKALYENKLSLKEAIERFRT
jgi:phosphoribosylformimino-5-aminoimidazole carboxamide ribotide isomerase